MRFSELKLVRYKNAIVFHAGEDVVEDYPYTGSAYRFQYGMTPLLFVRPLNLSGGFEKRGWQVETLNGIQVVGPEDTREDVYTTLSLRFAPDFVASAYAKSLKTYPVPAATQAPAKVVKSACNACPDKCNLYFNGFEDLCKKRVSSSSPKKVQLIKVPVPDAVIDGKQVFMITAKPETDKEEFSRSWEVIDPKTFKHIKKSLSLLLLPRKEFPEKIRFPAQFPPKPDPLTCCLVERSRGVHSYSYWKMLRHEARLREKRVKYVLSTASGWIPEEGLESKHELPTTTADHVAYRQEDVLEDEVFNPETMVSMAESLRKFRLQDAGVVRVRKLVAVRKVHSTKFIHCYDRVWYWCPEGIRYQDGELKLVPGEFHYTLKHKFEKVDATEPIAVYDLVQVPSYRPVDISKHPEVIMSGVTDLTRHERNDRRKKGIAARLERQKDRDRVKLDKLEYMIKTGQVHFR